MANNHEQSSRSGSNAVWIWADDNTVIDHSVGVLVVSELQWKGLPEHIIAFHRPVRTKTGLAGRGIVVENLLVILLE